MNHLSDKELWASIKQGKKTAFDYLYQQNVKAMFYYAYSLHKDKGLIEDCIQEVFIQLWKSRNKIEIEHSIKQYLLLSLRRLIFKRVKQLNKVISASPSINENLAFEIEISVETAWINEEIKKGNSLKLKKAIQNLSNREKEAIFLRYYENQDYESIAKVMGIGIKAVYKLVHSGIKKLRNLLT